MQGFRCVLDAAVDAYMVSPLTLGGECVDILLSPTKPVRHVSVGNKPTAGGTAPIRLPDALAMAAAEAMGGAMIIQALSGLEVSWSLRVCPLDLRTMAISFGAPEEAIFHLANGEVNAYCHGQEPGPPWFILHTQAKLPDMQAAAERMSQLVFAAPREQQPRRAAGARSCLRHCRVGTALLPRPSSTRRVP